MKTRGKRKGSNLTPPVPAIPAGRGKRIGRNLTPPEPAIPAGRGKRKGSNVTPPVPAIPAGRGKRTGRNLTPPEPSSSESGSDSSDGRREKMAPSKPPTPAGSDGEPMDNVIAKFNECMERSAEVLLTGLELISKEFGYGDKVVKEKDLMLKLIGKCETQKSPEALEAVVQYVITKFGSLVSALWILVEGSMDWNKHRRLIGGSTDWNRKVAKCVYNATQKFKEDFFAQVESVETLNEAADRLIKLSDDDNDWLVLAGCTHLRTMVRNWIEKKKSIIIRRCLANYPTLKKATLEELRSRYQS